jgi:hypothetical protein
MLYYLNVILSYKNYLKRGEKMITKRYTAMIGIKAPEIVEQFYKQKAKKKLREMKLDIPSELVLLVLKVKKLYKRGLLNISIEDEKVIDQIAKEYGITKGDALTVILAHNFPEVKDFLIKLTKEETNNGKEKTKE